MIWYGMIWYNVTWYSKTTIFQAIPENTNFLKNDTQYMPISWSSNLYRISLSWLRTSSHRLGIETGRWRRPVLPREQRKCPRCNKTDDEYHFLLECCVLKDLRTQLVPAYYWKLPSMFKCIQLLNSSDKTLNKLAKYVHRGFMLKSWIAMLVMICGLPWFSCMLYCMDFVLLYRL